MVGFRGETTNEEWTFFFFFGTPHYRYHTDVTMLRQYPNNCSLLVFIKQHLKIVVLYASLIFCNNVGKMKTSLLTFTLLLYPYPFTQQRNENKLYSPALSGFIKQDYTAILGISATTSLVLSFPVSALLLLFPHFPRRYILEQSLQITQSSCT